MEAIFYFYLTLISQKFISVEVISSNVEFSSCSSEKSVVVVLAVVVIVAAVVVIVIGVPLAVVEQ